MQREIAEQIVQAMKELDRALGQLDQALWRVEDEVERRRMLRVLFGLAVDSYHHITRPVVHQFPDLHPDPPPDFRGFEAFKPPGLPIRRIDEGPRLSEATVYDDLVHLSGMVPEDASQDIAGQTKQVLAEIDFLLKKAGSHPTKILSALIFLTDMEDLAGMNAVWDEWMAEVAAPPARATVQAKLSDPNAKIEIMVVAAL
jgi:enamine deaminase RidA (YjgF/YER057c/UK114 family)